MFDKVFATQVGFSSVIVGFCMYMIIKDNDSNTTSVFLPIMTGIISLWFNIHSIPKKNDISITSNNEEHISLLKPSYESV